LLRSARNDMTTTIRSVIATVFGPNSGCWHIRLCSVVYRMNNEIREDASLRRRVGGIERELQMNDPPLTP
jgi:hypothetical protein